MIITYIIYVTNKPGVGRMMVEEEQISFRSGSLMVDGVEDYTHQIAEMIGLPNESNFIESGVSAILFTV